MSRGAQLREAKYDFEISLLEYEVWISFSEDRQEFRFMVFSTGFHGTEERKLVGDGITDTNDEAVRRSQEIAELYTEFIMKSKAAALGVSL